MDNFDEKDSKQDSSQENGGPDVINKGSERKAKAGLIIWRCVSFLMMIFFLMAAGVQFNDPDPWLWVPLYGIASFLTACVTVRPNLSEEKVWRYTYFIHTAYSSALFIYVLVELFIAFGNPEADGALNPLTYEEGRELAGILITTVWLFICQQSPIIKCSVPKCSLSCCKKNKSQPFTRDKAVDYGQTSLLPPSV